MKNVKQILIPVISTLCLTAGVLSAQTSKSTTSSTSTSSTVNVTTNDEGNGKDKQVHIHIVTEKDGKRVVIDTVLNNPSESDMMKYSYETNDEKGGNCIVNVNGGGGKTMKVIVKNDSKGGDSSVIINTISDTDIEKEMKDMGIEIKKGSGNCVMVIKDETMESDGKGEKKVTRVMIKKVEIAEVTKEERKSLGKGISSDDNLKVEKLEFYPNPNNGKFNLSFNLTEKGNTNVSVFNTEGKKVYEENLGNFSGEYNKSIDLSGSPKGIYFLNVMQGKNSMVKKIVID